MFLRERNNSSQTFCFESGTLFILFSHTQVVLSGMGAGFTMFASDIDINVISLRKDGPEYPFWKTFFRFVNPRWLQEFEYRTQGTGTLFILSQKSMTLCEKDHIYRNFEEYG